MPMAWGNLLYDAQQCSSCPGAFGKTAGAAVGSWISWTLGVRRGDRVLHHRVCPSVTKRAPEPLPWWRGRCDTQGAYAWIALRRCPPMPPLCGSFWCRSCGILAVPHQQGVNVVAMNADGAPQADHRQLAPSDE